MEIGHRYLKDTTKRKKALSKKKTKKKQHINITIIRDKQISIKMLLMNTDYMAKNRKYWQVSMQKNYDTHTPGPPWETFNQNFPS